MIIALDAVVRNNTKKSFIAFPQFAQMIVSRNTVVQYHNQDIDRDMIYQSYADEYLYSLV